MQPAGPVLHLAPPGAAATGVASEPPAGWRADPPALSLVALSRRELEALASSSVPVSLAARLEDGALPPAFVAARSLANTASGQTPPWSTTFVIERGADRRVVGACGFKRAPCQGRVEVGYGVAPGARNRGVATEALGLLLSIAFRAGARQVVADVAPHNHASTRVVQKHGFVRIGAGFDEDREYVVRWARTPAAPAAW